MEVAINSLAEALVALDRSRENLELTQRAMVECAGAVREDVPQQPYLICEHCHKGTKRKGTYISASGLFYCDWCNRFSSDIVGEIGEGKPVEVEEA